MTEGKSQNILQVDVSDQVYTHLIWTDFNTELGTKTLSEIYSIIMNKVNSGLLDSVVFLFFSYIFHLVIFKEKDLFSLFKS